MVFYEMVTSLTRAQKRFIFLMIDGLMVPMALLLSVLLNASVSLNWGVALSLAPLAAILISIAFVSSHFLGLTRIKLNAYEFQGILPTTIFSGILGVSGLALNYAFGNPITPETFFIFTMALVIMGVSTRMFLRQTLIQIYRSGADRMRVLVYGAGHPYAIPFTGSGTEASIASLTRDDLVTLTAADIRGSSVFAEASQMSG